MIFMRRKIIASTSLLKTRSFATTLVKCPSSLILKDYITKYKDNAEYNIPLSILEKVGIGLHNEFTSPLCITKQKIYNYCNTYAKSKLHQIEFKTYDNLSPIVRPLECFDELRVPSDHVSRSKSDTYYLSNEELLRTHTSAHQCSIMNTGELSFLCSGDVYRRDTVDESHYPVFHQMEGVRLYTTEYWNKLDPNDELTIKEKKIIIADDLKDILSGLARELFGNDIEMRWNNDYFPFTEPSFELEVLFNDKWLEVLGCGVIHDDVIVNAGLNPNDTTGYAFGLGLERLAMVLFGINDIRLFWSQDERFKSQFKEGKIIQFKPYSKYPMCTKDVSFWTTSTSTTSTPSTFHENDIHEIIRHIAGDLVEKVELFDEFKHPKTGRESQAYRITYRHMDRSLTNEEIDKVQEQVRLELVKKLNIELR